MAKRLKLNIEGDGKISVTDFCQEVGDKGSGEKRSKVLRGKVVSCENNKLRFVPENYFEDADQFLEKYFKEITEMGLEGANTNKVIELGHKMIEIHTKLILKSLEIEKQATVETVAIIEETSHHITEQLKKIRTVASRSVEFRKNVMFVEPKEISLKLKWKTKTHPTSDLPSNSFIPSTCQFVSICKTLSAIFSQADFELMYSNYNSKEKHQCQDGIFVDFCCGTTYKSKEIFQNPNVIQIQLGIDDFEVCCPVKSKATKHKICGIYFQIRNLPANIVSKIDNIFLVGLVSSEDLKDDAILNDVNELIVFGKLLWSTFPAII